jgi:chromosome segregation ATPase
VLKKKMSQTSDLIRALEDRHESVEDTIRQVGECLFQLQRAHRSKWAPLNVCERRLELRDTRPLQELVRDHAQDALEHERQTLIESRQELSDQVQSCKEMLLKLDRTRQDVIEDLSHKRHAQRIDRSCLSPNKHDIIHGDRVVLPQLGEVSHYAAAPSPKDAASGTGHVHEESRQVDTKSLIQSAVKIEEEAMRLCNESDAVMLQTKRECQRAAAQAQTSLARRADETDGLKRKLEAQMKEQDEAIAQTEMSLGRTKKKLEFHETPLKTLDKQFAMRSNRTDREGIRDHVHEELEAQLEQVKKSVRTLTDKFQNTKSLLDHLKESREQLTEDYRCKLLAIKIEDACLKVTPRKAIELNRSDPRGGRCKLPSRKGTPRKEGNLGSSMVL